MKKARWDSETVWTYTENLSTVGVRTSDGPGPSELLCRLRHYSGGIQVKCPLYDINPHSLYASNYTINISISISISIGIGIGIGIDIDIKILNDGGFLGF